ncbi:YitT family protein [symbiont of Argiope bruennichi]|uniref:YitT family protein n=1 Tax=symbiont of Argiope bruennichi TaxID=2810479 RepID=UPI003DA404E3
MKNSYKKLVLKYVFFSNKEVYRFFSRLKWILFSATLNFLALQLFVVKTKAISGGITGIALFLFNLFSIHLQDSARNDTIFLFLIQLLLNLPFIIFGYLKIGKKFTILTLFYLGFELIFSLGYSYFNLEQYFDFFKGNKGVDISDASKIISCFIGGIFYGFGCVCAYNALGSTGGTDFITVYYNYKYNKNIGKVNALINSFVVVIGIFILSKQKNASVSHFFGVELLATFTFCLTYSFLIDNFFPRQKNVSVFIITSDELKIKEAFKEGKFQRSYTRIDSIGAFKGTKNVVLLTTMTIFEYHKIIEKIKKHDPNAFVFVSKIWRISGNFRRISWND